MKFVKKPIIVEAFRLLSSIDPKKWPEWLTHAWNKKRYEEGAFWLDPDADDGFSVILHGNKTRVEWGDWIIKGVNEELYPCKSDIFDKTYNILEPIPPIKGIQTKLLESDQIAIKVHTDDGEREYVVKEELFIIALENA